MKASTSLAGSIASMTWLRPDAPAAAIAPGFRARPVAVQRLHQGKQFRRLSRSRQEALERVHAGRRRLPRLVAKRRLWLPDRRRPARPRGPGCIPCAVLNWATAAETRSSRRAATDLPSINCAGTVRIPHNSIVAQATGKADPSWLVGYRCCSVSGRETASRGGELPRAGIPAVGCAPRAWWRFSCAVQGDLPVCRATARTRSAAVTLSTRRGKHSSERSKAHAGGWWSSRLSFFQRRLSTAARAM